MRGQVHQRDRVFVAYRDRPALSPANDLTRCRAGASRGDGAAQRPAAGELVRPDLLTGCRADLG